MTEQWTDPKEDRNFFQLNGEITLESTAEVIEWIMVQNSWGKDVPRFDKLFLLINSEGGDLSAAFSLIDIMRGSEIPITTIGLGTIASAAFCIFIAGEERIITPRTTVMSHCFQTVNIGTHNQIMNETIENGNVEGRMIEFYCQQLGLKPRLIQTVLLGDHDAWLHYEDSIKFNVCHSVVETVDMSEFVKS